MKLKRSDDEMRWKTVSSEYIIREPWMTVRKDKMMLPDGRVKEGYWSLEYPDWINVIALTKSGEFIFERQYRHGLGIVEFEIPAGVIEKGETPLEAARRELMEETGELVTSDKRWKNHRNTHYDKSNKLEELSDCFITLFNVAMYSGISAEELGLALTKKMDENIKRIREA